MSRPTVDLDGKRILVTGGGAGLGRGLCVHFGSAGARVVVTGRGPNVEETVAAIREAGGEALSARCDATRASDVEGAVALAVDRLGGLDAMVHNATSRSSSIVSSIEDLTEDAWRDHLAVSVRAGYLCARAALPHLEQSRGALVLMTSPAAMEGSATLPGYAAVKGALRGMTKSLALEWGPRGVRVVAVSPLARTPALDNAFIENPELEGRLEALVPLGWIGEPEPDVAPVVAWIVSDGGRYVTGQTVVVDGGRFTGL